MPSRNPPLPEAALTNRPGIASPLASMNRQLYFCQPLMKSLGVLETRGNNKSSVAIDKPGTPVLPRRGAALRKLPREIECSGNDKPTREVDKPVFAVHGDGEQTVLGTQPTCLLRAQRRQKQREQKRTERGAYHYPML